MFTWWEHFGVMWWPRFDGKTFWILRQAVYAILYLGIGLEIGWRTFRWFPGAASAARKTALAILTVSALTMISQETWPPGWPIHLGLHLHAPAVDGALWLMAATMVLARWYRVPLHPFHAAVLTGQVASTAFFTTIIGLYDLYAWPWLDILRPSFYLLLWSWWAVLAWRPESQTARAHVATLRRLELRGASCG
jgi:hypothetical protein